MKSTTLDVTTYIDEQPQDWQSALKSLDINWAVVTSLLSSTAASDAEIC